MVTGAQSAHPDALSLLAANPRYLADAMVGATESTLWFGDVLNAHDLGFQAVAVAYEHVVAGAVRLARQLQAWETTEPSDTAYLKLRAHIDVAGRLAVRMRGHEGNVEPPTWSVKLDEIAAREDPGVKEGETGVIGRNVASRIRTTITLRRPE